MYVKVGTAEHIFVLAAAASGQSDVQTRGQFEDLLHFEIVRSDPTQGSEHRLLHHVAQTACKPNIPIS